MRNIDLLVVHCSATQASLDVGATEIRKWHKAQGWRDIGYHWVIRRNGNIEPGRPEDQAGAHAEGYNANSIGVCLVGGGNAQGRGEDNFEPVQKQSLQVLLGMLRERYPNTQILGHRDLSPDRNRDGVISPNEWIKECPSFNVRAWCAEVGIDPARPAA